ncbi:MAG: 3-phosphoshikimate 1-carboxyvinyltransferase, partial [Pseudomonadales bacterium]|nr:3-phosphoshikimate 1-carboxyvinyltransferase [Pseudomonadales bacterium]
MTQLTLAPIHEISGEVRLPGSKSLSNRALLLAGLARGSTRLTNLLKSEDTQRMVDALLQLGVHIELSNDWTDFTIHGNAGLFDAPLDQRFFMGNAGTAIRPLTAVLALIKGRWEIDGDTYMRKRPIHHLVNALRQLGTPVSYLGKEDCPPLLIEGGLLQGGDVSVSGDISSQFLTALLMSLPLAKQDSLIIVNGKQVSKPYVKLTLDCMSRFGVEVKTIEHSYPVTGRQEYQSPGDYLIEGDASSASYFLGAAAVAGNIKVYGLGRNSIQGDLAFVDVLEKMGARVKKLDQAIEVSKGPLTAVDVDLNHIPDAAMTVAMLALFAKGTTCIRNIYNWRVKETDRMTAMQTELSKLGAIVKTGSDYICITPPEKI